MLSVVETACLKEVQDFADTAIAPEASSWSQGVAPDPALFLQAAELGLTRLEVPTRDGGLGYGFSLKAKVCEVLAAADFGFAMSVVNTHNVALKLAEHGATDLKTRHLPALLWGQASACTALTERGAGSDVGAMQMRAERQGDGWVLNGEKTWIINARHAALAIVYAQCGEQGDRDGIGAFLVDLTAPGCSRYALASAFPQSSMGTGGFTLKDYQLQEDALLVKPGEAFRSIMTEINGARIYVAAMCSGMMEAALAKAAAYGGVRQSFGRPLAGHQAWRFALARAETDLAATRHLIDAATDRLVSGEDAQLLSAQAKIHAVSVCQRHLPELLHAMGAEGLRQDYPFTRHLAAAQIAALVDGSTEMLLERVAKLARAAPDATSFRKDK